MLKNQIEMKKSDVKYGIVVICIRFLMFENVVYS